MDSNRKKFFVRSLKTNVWKLSPDDFRTCSDQHRYLRQPETTIKQKSFHIIHLEDKKPEKRSENDLVYQNRIRVKI